MVEEFTTRISANRPVNTLLLGDAGTYAWACAAKPGATAVAPARIAAMLRVNLANRI